MSNAPEGEGRKARVVDKAVASPDVVWKARMAAQRAEFQKVVDDANAKIAELRALLIEEQVHARGTEDAYRGEIRRRQEVESELENLKKGSIAMTKYVTNLQRKKHDEEIRSMKDQLRELQREVDRAKRLALEAHSVRTQAGSPEEGARGGGGFLHKRRKRA